MLIFCLFCAGLVACLILKWPILLALVFGLVLFIGTAFAQKHTVREVAGMCASGFVNSWRVLLSFVLIGLLTATWRMSGCIPTVVTYASQWISPSIYLLLAFLLCTLISLLTGTAFGSSATMGVICMTVGTGLGISPFWLGGAIMSGVYVGDRCSPFASNAQLIAGLTDTDVYANFKRMTRAGLLPFVLSAVLYLAVGLVLPSGTSANVSSELFSTEFVIHPLCLLPAVLIVVLALLKMDVRLTMALSIVSAVVLSFTVQGTDVSTLCRALVWGYEAKNETVAPLINGGGLFSMLNVACIVAVASCYTGLFKGTGILGFIERFAKKLNERLGDFPALVILSFPISCIACSQTLSVMLTSQMTDGIDMNKEKKACMLCDSVSLISALLPWSTAFAVPFDTVGAPYLSIFVSFFLWLCPLWGMVYYKSRGGFCNTMRNA